METGFSKRRLYLSTAIIVVTMAFTILGIWLLSEG